jgi:HEAT repeat protein
MAPRKHTSHLFLASVLICFALGAVALLWRPGASTDLVYAGRSMDEWLDDLAVTPEGPHILTPKATAVIREIGEESIPTLLAWVKRSDNSLVEALHYRYGIKVPLNRAWRTRGFYGFRALGDKMDVAIPELVELAMYDPNEGVRSAAINSLTEGRPLTNELLSIALTDAEPDRRSRAANVLGYLRPPGAIVPLTQALVDPDHHVRLQSLRALRCYTDPLLPKSTLEAIELCASVSESDVREAAQAALNYQKDYAKVNGD